MTPKYDVALLRVQLAAALDERARGEGDTFELAVLGGLLERAGDGSASGLRADLAGALDAIDIQVAVDRVAGIDEGDEPEVVDSALFALDEICAAAAFLGVTEAICGEVDLAVRAIQAFPHAYRKRADLASAVLDDHRFAPGDPAGDLWRAVEASRVEPEVGPTAVPSFETLMELGLPAVISLRPIAEESRTRLAAAALTPEPPWERVFLRGGWEVAITTGKDGLRVVVSAPEGATPEGTVDGVAVRFDEDEFRIWSYAATPGQWHLDLGRIGIDFEIEP